jgi:putative ABC transport system ATP-binding protein
VSANGEAATPLISYRDVHLDTPDGPILRGATGDVPAAGITVVVGPSGSGKSTLLRLANRLEVQSSGRVAVLGEDTAAVDPLALRRRIGMVFQRPVLFPGTVAQNLRVADPSLDDPAARALLARAALPAEFLNRDTSTLSGGEAQRVCIARALAAGPAAILMDEPTSSLDPAAREEIEQLARELARGGLPVVWVTHDQVQMRRLADHVLVVIDGTIAYAGSPDGLPAASAEAASFVEQA